MAILPYQREYGVGEDEPRGEREEGGGEDRLEEITSRTHRDGVVESCWWRKKRRRMGKLPGSDRPPIGWGPCGGDWSAD